MENEIIIYKNRKGKKVLHKGFIKRKVWEHPLDRKTELFIKGKMSLKNFLKYKAF